MKTTKTFAILILLALSGCPGKGAKPAGPKPCTAFGEPCEFSPGKLGSCVIRDNCTGPNCLVCQSQH